MADRKRTRRRSELRRSHLLPPARRRRVRGWRRRLHRRRPPGYADGSLSDWLEFLCRESVIEIDSLREFSHGEMRGLRFDGRQAAESTTLNMCNLYIEDGGRLFAICSMAIAPLFPAIAPVLSAIAESFRVDAVSGPTVPLSN